MPQDKTPQLPSQILQASQDTGLLDTEPEEAFDRLAALAGRLAGAPTALLTILDRDRQFFKAGVGLSDELEEKRETPLSQSICRHVAGKNEPLVIPDTRQHPLSTGNSVIEQHGVAAYCGVPLRLPDGRPFGALCVIDQHPRGWEESLPELLEELARSAMTEVELRRQARSLKELTERQNEILGTVAHDLRTPLAVIKGYSKLLLHERISLEDKPRAMVEAIQRIGGFMLRLVDDLLDLEALKTGKVQLDLAETDIVELVGDVVEMVAAKAAMKDIELKFECRIERLSLAVDSGKFEQIVYNILGNAVKFSPQGTTVTATLAIEGVEVHLSIQDQGPGISKDEAVKIFEPFATGKARSTDGEKSTGLGLAIAKRLTEAHRGTIGVESDGPGTGALFRVSLPIG